MLLKLIKGQRPNVDKIYLCVKGLFEWKYQLLINGGQKVGIKTLKSPEAFIDYNWVVISNWWCLWIFGRLKANKEKESVSIVRWYDSNIESK